MSHFATSSQRAEFLCELDSVSPNLNACTWPIWAWAFLNRWEPSLRCDLALTSFCSTDRIRGTHDALNLHDSFIVAVSSELKPRCQFLLESWLLFSFTRLTRRFTSSGAVHRQSDLLVLRVQFWSSHHCATSVFQLWAAYCASLLSGFLIHVHCRGLPWHSWPGASFVIHVHRRGLTRAEEKLLCMAPFSCPALQDRTSAIRTSLAAAAAHTCDQASRGQRTPLGRFREEDS